VSFFGQYMIRDYVYLYVEYSLNPMKKSLYLFITLLILLTGITSCGDCPVSENDTPYTFPKPSHFPSPSIPADNPLTVNKIKLGRMLFYDKALSEDQLISCASCHKQQLAFASDKALDTKVHGGTTKRNSMPLFNLVFSPNYFWDGRTNTLEATCLDALKDEQNFQEGYIKSRLFGRYDYKELFKIVFNTENPTEDMVAKCLASFIRTMISANSPVDRGVKEGNVNKYLSAQAQQGKILFESEDGDCFHCHGAIQGLPQMTDNLFHNNGLDSVQDPSKYKDFGYGKVTGNASDNSKMRTPALRNLSYTKPFMHDGRIPNLDAVLEHYNRGVKLNVNIDVLMEKRFQGGINLDPVRTAQLKAYLLSFDDPDFISDTAFSSPF
jgi:cytochrome c peroxidase